MALEQKLQLRLAQKLVMTPSLQQAIKLLQMTRMELQSTLSQELEENPVLEEGEIVDEAPKDEDGEAEAEEAEAEDPMDDIDLEAYFNDYLEGSTSPHTQEIAQAPPIENSLSREPDLYDHLLWQLHMLDIPARQCEIAELIIGNLDPEGFLVATAEEIRAMGDHEPEQEPYTLDEVEEALALVQSLDPPGVACHDLRESLLHQLDAIDEPEDSLVRRAVADHWAAFLRR